MEIVVAGSILSVPIQRRLFLPGALILLSLGTVSQSSKGYVLEGEQWPAGSTVNFQLALGSAGRTLIDGNTSWNTAAAPAPIAWDNVMGNLVFQVTPQAAIASSGDGRNTIVFSSTVFGDSFGSRTLAETVYLFSGSTIQEADTIFNNHLRWDSYRGALRYDANGNAVPEIRRVLIHEMGHALGLDHPDQHGQHVDAIMNSIVSNRETLSPDDIAGAQHLYGAAGVGIKADFNADRRSDYLLFNPSTHRTAIWYLQNGALLSGAYGPTLPAGWAPVGTADVNVDGKPDYILFNPSTHQTAIWYLSGSAYIGGGYGPTLPAGWTLVAVTDMDGDGHPDYVLFNPATNQSAIWFLNATRLTRGVYGPVIFAGWVLADANDFNRDGKSDFVLLNTATNDTLVWFINGAAISDSSNGPTLPDGWTLQGTADFNRDGKPDYVLFNPSTGETDQWYLDGTAYSSEAPGPTIPAGYVLIAR